MSQPKRTANKGSFKKGAPGRPKGIPNKVTTAAKEAFVMAFEAMGGVDRLTLWAKLNPTEFYKLYARLIPIDHTSGGEALAPIQGMTIIAAKDAPEV